MKTLFLGTAAGKPSTYRNVTSIAVVFDNYEFLLFDCGEATQHQIMRSSLKLTKLTAIYITHLHGDHIFGLPGLLSSLSDCRTEPLNIYGPSGLKDFLKFPCKSIHNYKINIHELENVNQVIGQHYVGNYQIEIKASIVDHGVTCFAYNIVKKRAIKGINMSVLRPELDKYRSEIERKYGTPAEKIINKMKKQETFTMENGFCFDLKKYCIEEKTKSLVIALDNYNSNQMQQYFGKCDVLIHECTYAIFNSMSPKEKMEVANLARCHKHATNVMAYQVAKALGAKHLILTHFSNRYEFKDEDNIICGVSEYMQSLVKIDCARDFSSFDIL
jgi:ribonuclease Z